MTRYKTSVRIILIVLLIGGIFVVGILVGRGARLQKNSYASVVETVDGADIELGEFWKVWSLLQEKFPFDEVPSAKEKVYGAIGGLVESYDDPYSVYFPPGDSKLFAEDIRGAFGGVGMEVGIRDGVPTVIAPLKDSPAEVAGILSGDIIFQVDGESVLEESLDETISRIRGKEGTEVVLTMIREGEDEPLEIAVMRDTIKVPTLDTVLRDDGIFVIELYNFSEDSPNLFRDALQEFIDAKTDKLIIDLRGNPGGFLEAAVDMASWFLPKGKVIVTESGANGHKDTEHRSKGYDIFTDQLKLVVLIDGGSASAAEILAGALAEHGKAELVGETTFGKGSVQELINITKETSLKVTVAEWLTPNGNQITDEGITPDYDVVITREDREAERDPQLEKAVELLLKN